MHYLTKTELRQLHRRFSYPAADQLYKVLKKAEYNNISKDTINKINKFCH